jgi:hypothetical protein
MAFSFVAFHQIQLLLGFKGTENISLVLYKKYNMEIHF